MTLFLLSLAVILLSSLFLVSTFKPANWIAAVLGWYLLVFALVVLSEWIGHYFGWLAEPENILLIHLILMGLSGLVWHRSGRPQLGGPLFNGRVFGMLIDWKDAWAGRLENILLTLAALIFYGYAFFLGWKVAPNTYDSITTHAVRVVYWLQHGTLLPWNSPRVTQLVYPVNAQLQMLWSAQFIHSDRLFFLVQYFGGISTVLCIIGLARLLKFSRSQSLFAGLMFACLPLIWMQASTTQNDLAAAGIFLPVIYFFYLGIHNRQGSMLILSAIALGLSLGTKQTLFFYLPGLALLVGLVWKKYRSEVTRQIILWGAASLAAFMLLSSHIYIQNTVYFQHPLAPQETLEVSVSSINAGSTAGNLKFNTVRLLYNSVDGSGLWYPWNVYFAIIKERTLGAVVQAVIPDIETAAFTAPGHQFSLSAQNYLSEDASWFGPLGGILLFGLAVIQLITGIKQKDPWRLGFMGIAVVFLVVDAWLRPGWDPFQGRYFIPAAALTAPFFATLSGHKIWSRIVPLVVGVIAILILGYSAMINPGKWALIEKPRTDLFSKNISTLDSLTWVEGVTLQNRGARDYVNMVLEHVPMNATLGWYVGNFIEYPLFNADLSRRLVAIYPHDRLRDTEWLLSQGLDYILLDADLLDGRLPEGFSEVDSTYNWMLIKRQ